VCEWFLSPCPLPGRLGRDGAAGGGAEAGVVVAGVETSGAVGLGAACAGALGCAAGAGVGAGGVGGAGGAGAGGMGVGAGGVTGGGVVVGGCGERPVFTAGRGPDEVARCGGVAANAAPFLCDGSATARFGPGSARGSAAATTTVWGSARRLPPAASGSTNGADAGVSASDHSRADPATHAAATSTAASRRAPTLVYSRGDRTTS
jgi:hypothetical protein